MVLRWIWKMDQGKAWEVTRRERTEIEEAHVRVEIETSRKETDEMRGTL